MVYIVVLYSCVFTNIYPLSFMTIKIKRLIYKICDEGMLDINICLNPQANCYYYCDNCIMEDLFIYLFYIWLIQYNTILSPPSGSLGMVGAGITL